MFPEFHENFTIDFHELLDLPENPAWNVPFYDRAVMNGYGGGFTGRFRVSGASIATLIRAA